MITITILIGIIVILSYLLFREHNKPQIKIDTPDNQNIARYNLITKVFLDIFAQSQHLNTKVKILTGDNESLKKEIQKLEQQVNTLLQESQKTLELNNKLQIQNTIFQQRNQDLETNQKTFIQKLGGIVYKENLEDKTWDLVLEKAQMLMNERNEAVIKIQSVNRDIEVIKHKNELFIKEKDSFNQSLEVLRSIIATKDIEIISLTQQLEFKVKESQCKSDNSIELAQIKNELKNLQNIIIQKDDLIQSLEIEKGENSRKISSLEANVTTEKSNCELLTQQKMSLHSRVQQLEGEIQVLNDKPINSDIEKLESQIVKKDNEINALKLENHQNAQEIKQLETKLTEKELELKITIRDTYNSIQELEQRIAYLTGRLRNKVGDSNGLIEELEKQIAQKDAVIKKLESEIKKLKFENSQNCESIKLLSESFDELTENFDELTKNFKDKEYQLKLVTREKIDLDNRIKELEGNNSILNNKLNVISETMTSGILRQNNIYRNKLQQLQKQIVQRNTYISKLEQDLDKYIECLNDLENKSYFNDDQIIECIYVCCMGCEEEKEKLQQYIDYLQHYL